MDHYFANHTSFIGFKNTEPITLNAGEAKSVIVYPEVDLPVNKTVIFGIVDTNPNGIQNIIAYPSGVYSAGGKLTLRIFLYNSYSSSFTIPLETLTVSATIGYES